ncbi:hypothetical protein K438DRAFT_1148538 [Mycena galopus ATCC 62051]|nr:hypothetical protein K438DRAFT_1148538 [Mycena galopus ATCC 62051]
MAFPQFYLQLPFHVSTLFLGPFVDLMLHLYPPVSGLPTRLSVYQTQTPFCDSGAHREGKVLLSNLLWVTCVVRVSFLSFYSTSTSLPVPALHTSSRCRPCIHTLATSHRASCSLQSRFPRHRVRTESPSSRSPITRYLRVLRDTIFCRTSLRQRRNRAHAAASCVVRWGDIPSTFEFARAPPFSCADLSRGLTMTDVLFRLTDRHCP